MTFLKHLTFYRWRQMETAFLPKQCIRMPRLSLINFPKLHQANILPTCLFDLSSQKKNYEKMINFIQVELMHELIFKALSRYQPFWANKKYIKVSVHHLRNLVFIIATNFHLSKMSWTCRTETKTLLKIGTYPFLHLFFFNKQNIKRCS